MALRCGREINASERRVRVRAAYTKDDDLRMMDLGGGLAPDDDLSNDPSRSGGELERLSALP